MEAKFLQKINEDFKHLDNKKINETNRYNIRAGFRETLYKKSKNRLYYPDFAIIELKQNKAHLKTLIFTGEQNIWFSTKGYKATGYNNLSSHCRKIGEQLAGMVITIARDNEKYKEKHEKI